MKVKRKEEIEKERGIVKMINQKNRKEK